MSNRESNRFSVANRKRRTTIINDKNLEDLIKDDYMADASKDNFKSMIIEEAKDEDKLQDYDKSKLFQSVVVADDEDQDMFDQITYSKNRNQELRNTTASVFQTKRTVKTRNMEDIELLQKLDADQGATGGLGEDNFEMNMDELMMQAEVIHEERRRTTAVHDDLIPNRPSDVHFEEPQSHLQPIDNLRVTEIVQKEHRIEEMEEVKSHTFESDIEPEVEEIVYGEQLEVEKPNSNDQSMVSGEDPDDYLKQLQEEESKRKASRILGLMGYQFQQELDLRKSFSLKNKDLFDDIQQLESQEESKPGKENTFSLEFYQAMHVDVLMGSEGAEDKHRSQRLQELTKDETSQSDMIRVIDWNERRHQEVSKAKLRQNSELSLKRVNTSDIKMRIMTQLTTLNSISNKLQKEKQFSQARATAVGINDDLLFIGNSEGQVWMFDRENEEDYHHFSEKSKDFLGNAVTSIDIHPHRPEYVILGYQGGQLVLFDVVAAPKKSIKVIKDHHKAPILSVKFCDWQNDKSGHDQQEDQVQEDKRAWMFISIDTHGKVVINSITRILFVLKASKHIIIDPLKYSGSPFVSVACRFKSLHGAGLYDDMAIASIATSESVYIIEARTNNHQEFFKITRPDRYFNNQLQDFELMKPIAPVMSWGFGMTPVMKDRPHSLLAVGWGPLIQIVVLIDHELSANPFVMDGYYILKCLDLNPSPSRLRKSVRFIDESKLGTIPEEQEEDDQPAIEYNEYATSFTKPDLNIEQVFFMSDSTLLIVTSGQELRVLFTQAFFPDIYYPERLQSSLKQLEQSTPELETSIKIQNLLKSEFGSNYQQTVKFFAGKLALLTQRNVQTSQHLTWQLSLYEFKRQVEDDLIQVFSRALSIYKGNVKGYAGLPDDTFLRENFLKAELKLLVKEIIQQVIEKTKQQNEELVKNTYNEATPMIESGATKQEIRDTINQLHEFEDKRQHKFETLIRIAIEFCLELKDPDYLFKDLFWLFQEEQIEELFVKELEPFIMAGKFKEWELPNDVIQNHVIKYYKDASKAAALEKIIINLNLTKCPKTIVLEFIHFSEQNYLTTAILFLFTQVFERKDNSSCVQVLFSLLKLYKQAAKNNQASLIDLQMLREASYDSQDKLQIEKSQIYIGYKILWVIRLFLDGKKFPQGTIRERKWRQYIHDIIEFLANPEILKTLLGIDATALFQIISIMFYPSRPYHLVRQGREDTEQENFTTHVSFIKNLDKVILQEDISEPQKLQYLFFIAQVVARSPLEGLEPGFYYNITKELMLLHKRFLDFNRHVQELSMARKTKVNKRLTQVGLPVKYHMVNDQGQYNTKTENDYLFLLQRSEPLESEQIQELLKLTEFTQFNQVKVYLLEKKEEYIKCLQMLISSFKSSERQPSPKETQKVFTWIKDKLNILEERAPRSIKDKNAFDHFKRDIAQSIKLIVAMNPYETIKLVDEKFHGIHQEMIDQLKRDPNEQFLYLETLLEVQNNTIQETIKNYGLQSSNPQEAKRYIEFLKLHLRLCCQHKQDKVLSVVEKMVKNSYYPIQDCLDICLEFKQNEATFLLNKKLGKYYDCVRQGVSIMRNRIDLTKLKVELYFAKKSNIKTEFCIATDQLKECQLLDNIFKKVLNICRKHSKEVDQDKEELIWYIVIDCLLEMKMDERVKNKTYCKDYFSQRLQIFVDSMIRVIPFKNFLDHLLMKYHDIQFKDMKETIMEMFNNQLSEQIVLMNANNSIYKVNTELFQQYSLQSRSGILFRSRVCQVCKRYMDSFLYDDVTTTEELSHLDEDDEDDDNYYYDSSKEPIKIFACRHTFHIRCLKKIYGRKYGELDLVFSKKNEKLRCPTCNLKNYDIDNEKQTRGAVTQNRKAEKKAEPLEEMSFDDEFEKKQKVRAARMTMRTQSVMQKNQQKVNRRMDFYDSNKEGDWLNINDFRKIIIK